MTKYTTITVRKEVIAELDAIRRELKAKSLGETIMELIKIYRRIKAKRFVEEVKKIREKGLNDVKEEILKLRRLKWAKL
ncbi:MAG: hypothetical protein DRZ80_05730 [Thermoprotei archaeon]|nr:MAG: hypothetical protein DRZ80_05730 [Thermoprotei archaeon]